MRKFILYAISIFATYLFVLEIVTRLLNLSAHTLPEFNLDGNRLLTPKAEGVISKGGMREIVSHYKINQQGFNSIVDYGQLDKSKINIAVIGDSYIEGFHVDVENSIGRILENEINGSVQVHEFGKSCGNIVDFSLVFDKWIKGKYDHTFVLLSNKDIVSKEPCFMGEGHKVPQQSVFRKLYNKISFIRYLNINHKLSTRLKNLIHPSDESNLDAAPANPLDSINFEAFNLFDSTTVLMYEKGKLDTAIFERLSLGNIEILHQLVPVDYGFDRHWNNNGRTNYALTIKNYLENASVFKDQ